MRVTKPTKQTEIRDPAVKKLIVVTYSKTGNSTYYLRDKSLARRRLKLGTSKELTLDEARIKAIELIRNGYKPMVTVEQAFEMYEKVGILSGKRSIKRERQRFDAFVKPAIGKKDIKTINPLHIQHVLESLPIELGDATRNRYLAALRSFFRFSVDLDLCEKDPTRRFKLKREPVLKLFEVNDDLLNRISHAITWLGKDYPLVSCLVELLFLTGMRVGEALNLTWDDVQPSHNRILVRASKTGRARYVPFNQKCHLVLERWVLNSNRFPSSDWIFPTRGGTHHMSRPVRPWKKALKAAGLPAQFRFHDLRHVWASVCVKAGIPLYTVQGLLGHSTIRMTERYSSLAFADLLAASQRGSDLISKAQGDSK